MKTNKKKKDIWWRRRWFTRLAQKIFGLFVFRSFTLALSSRQSSHLSLDIKCENNVSFHHPNSSSLFQQADSLFWGWLILLQFFFFFSFYKHPTPTRVRHARPFIHREQGSSRAEDWARCPAGAPDFLLWIKQVWLVFLTFLKPVHHRASKSISGRRRQNAQASRFADETE